MNGYKENSQYLLRNAVTDYSVVGYTGVSSWVKALDRAELDKEKDACSGNTNCEGRTNRRTLEFKGVI